MKVQSITQGGWADGVRVLPASRGIVRGRADELRVCSDEPQGGGSAIWVAVGQIGFKNQPRSIGSFDLIGKIATPRLDDVIDIVTVFGSTIFDVSGCSKGEVEDVVIAGIVDDPDIADIEVLDAGATISVDNVVED